MGGDSKRPAESKQKELRCCRAGKALSQNLGMTASVQRAQSSAAIDKLASLWSTPLKASRVLTTPKHVSRKVPYIGGLSQRPYHSYSTGQEVQRERRFNPSFASPARYQRDHRGDNYTVTRQKHKPPRVSGPVKVIVNGEERLESRGMIWSSSILTGLSADTEPSFMLQFDSAKYIFNVSENTTRSFKTSGRSWRRTRGIFFTQSKIERVGGLPGELSIRSRLSILTMLRINHDHGRRRNRQVEVDGSCRPQPSVSQYANLYIQVC